MLSLIPATSSNHTVVRLQASPEVVAKHLKKKKHVRFFFLLGK
jgi:hypothetical protein